jgi:peptidase E
MATARGSIVLMGSGELTATMVEVHKQQLAGLGAMPRAVFLDTPAGFQLNADQLSRKAVEYFAAHISHPLSVASFRSAVATAASAAQQAFQELMTADFILIGPGSPTYAVRQWQSSSIPDIIKRRVEAGACLVAASAAALTVGRFTLPVYEIYKVGADPHWIEGIDILGSFGLNLVVIPHWNNAEGGNHDTRFCFMGEPRLRMLEALLPRESALLGLDEHTACIIDFAAETVCIKGLGSATLRRRGGERLLVKGTTYPLALLRGAGLPEPEHQPVSLQQPAESPGPAGGNSFWETVHAFEAAFYAGLERHVPESTVGALLELERIIWQAQEQPEIISQAREMLRDMIAELGTRMRSTQRSQPDGIAPLVEELLKLRNRLRQEKRWDEADEIRACLERLSVVIEDAQTGSRWRLAAAPAQG